MLRCMISHQKDKQKIPKFYNIHCRRGYWFTWPPVRGGQEETEERPTTSIDRWQV